jgi:cytochrome c
MDDRSNTIAGWILGAGIAALGFSILSGTIFHAEEPHEGKQGFAIEGVEAEGGEGGAAAVPFPNVLAATMAADGVAKGEAVFKKCMACHTVAAGGAAGIGPNLHGVVGRAIGSSGFAYSGALKGVGGPWSFESLNSWLTNPKKFAAGNKMTFAGLGKAEDRAAVILYLNSQGSNLPLPAAVAAPAEGAAPVAEGVVSPPADGAAPVAAAPAK